MPGPLPTFLPSVAKGTSCVAPHIHARIVTRSAMTGSTGDCIMAATSNDESISLTTTLTSQRTDCSLAPSKSLAPIEYRTFVATPVTIAMIRLVDQT